ncbi:replication factor A1 [Nematocida major]|uniref:replication factor A1 n=1 Tax=Nematocida major TaxID=1912982 RepID=UPI002008451B|nr:replication factor A1 [Nematocida major]KAH9387197.1 replication factor A1 [Nematocida major]
MTIREPELEVDPGCISRAFKTSSKNEKKVPITVRIDSIIAPDHSVLQSKIRLIVTDTNTVQECLLSSKYADDVSTNRISVGDIIKVGEMTLGTYSSKAIIYIKEILAMHRPGKESAWGSIGASPSKRRIDPETPRKDTKKEATTIKELNPFQSMHWRISAKVVSKSPTRTYTKDGRPGKVFNVIVSDGTDKCNITFFTEYVSQFVDKIELYKSYEITGGVLKLANKKYNEDVHDYEILADRSFAVTPIPETKQPVKIPSTLSKVAKLPNQVHETVSLLVVVTETGEVSTITRRKDQVQMKKRTLSVGDESGKCVPFILWEDVCDLNFMVGDVLLLENVRVTEYLGMPQIGLARDGVISFNPEVPEVFRLRGWYSRNADSMEKAPRKSTGGGQKVVALEEVKSEALEYATVAVTLLFVPEKSVLYKSCPSEGCNKKVDYDPVAPDMYFCSKCGISYEKCSYNYSANASVIDGSSSMWVSLFNESASCLFQGRSAQEMYDLSIEDADRYMEALGEPVGSDFVLNIRGKESTYNGEPCMRYSASSLRRMDYAEEAYSVLSLLEKAR